MTDECKIYKIVNTINNKVYVGQTWSTLPNRFSAHKKSNRCIRLYNAFNKHGRENFSIEEITVCYSQDEADYWEQYFIDYFGSLNNGYNAREGGSRGKMTEESKEKLYYSMKLLTIEKIKNKMPLKPDTFLGKPASEQTKSKMKTSQRKRRKKYYDDQFDFDNDPIGDDF